MSLCSSRAALKGFVGDGLAETTVGITAQAV